MIQAHADLIATLSQEQTAALARQLVASELVHIPQSAIPTLSGPELAELCVAEGLSHAQVVLCCSSEAGEFWHHLISALLRKPMYICARGETSQTLTDIEGRPIRTPVGSRIGCVPTLPPLPARVRVERMPKRDPRIIVSVAPNPKMPRSEAHRRYALYAEGMTVEQFVALGGRHADVRYDEQHGHIVLRMP